MRFSLSFSVALMLSMIVVTTTADAYVPKTGRQWLTAGLVTESGVLHDSTAGLYNRPNNTFMGGLGVRLGFQHSVAEMLSMEATGQLGSTYLQSHTAHPDGTGDPETAFTWKVGILGHVFPIPRYDHWRLSTGVVLSTAHLDAASMQSFGVVVKTGWLVWDNTEFAVIDFGYTIPFLHGLELPSSFTEAPMNAPQEWTPHQFELSFTWGF